MATSQSEMLIVCHIFLSQFFWQTFQLEPTELQLRVSPNFTTHNERRTCTLYTHARAYITNSVEWVTRNWGSKFLLENKFNLFVWKIWRYDQLLSPLLKSKWNQTVNDCAQLIICPCMHSSSICLLKIEAQKKYRKINMRSFGHLYGGRRRLCRPSPSTPTIYEWMYIIQCERIRRIICFEINFGSTAMHIRIYIGLWRTITNPNPNTLGTIGIQRKWKRTQLCQIEREREVCSSSNGRSNNNEIESERTETI